MQRPLTVLLVEDNRADARLVTELLSSSPIGQVAHVTTATRLSEALARLDVNGIDVVLLDLTLPDSHGLETVIAMRNAAPHTPVVVLTGQDDTLAPQALRAGAQDYLVKGRLDGAVLVRSVRYAVERQLLLERLEAQRIHERRERDRRVLDALSASDNAVGRELLGRGGLEAEHPQLFEQIFEHYRVLVSLAVDGVADIREGDPFEPLVERLAALDADAGDVMGLHERVFAHDVAVGAPLASTADEVAARSVFIEVMARLLNAYRADRWSASSHSEPAEEHQGGGPSPSSEG